MADHSESTSTDTKQEPVSFSLDASESELLEEFGVLLAAEYNYVAM